MLPPGSVVLTVEEMLNLAKKSQRECDEKGGYQSLDVVEVQQTEFLAVVTARVVHRDGSKEAPEKFSFKKSGSSWVIAK